MPACTRVNDVCVGPCLNSMSHSLWVTHLHLSHCKLQRADTHWHTSSRDKTTCHKFTQSDGNSSADRVTVDALKQSFILYSTCGKGIFVCWQEGGGHVWRINRAGWTSRRERTGRRGLDICGFTHTDSIRQMLTKLCKSFYQRDSPHCHATHHTHKLYTLSLALLAQ